jgi:hypothetical protein
MEYIIFNISELDKIDFSQVNEDSFDTLRYSTNGQLTFVNWEGKDEPSFVSQLSTGTLYTKADIFALLRTDEWEIVNNLI